MFNFIDGFGKGDRGVEDARIQSVPPLFNSRNILEWNLPPDKRFLQFSKTRVVFHIDVPSNYVLDNDVFAKLIENTEINLSYETITHKSSALDNPVSNFMLNKATYDESYVRTSMSVNGWFDARNYDAAEINFAKLQASREMNSETIQKQLNYKGVNYIVNWKRYYFRFDYDFWYQH